MTRTTIIGVDYSGAKDDNGSWVTQAVLQGIRLRLESCYPLPRIELTQQLLKRSGDPDAVVGLDFPFGVPRAFAHEEFDFRGTLMSEMWNTIAQLPDLPQYIADIRPRLRNGDLQGFNKFLRQGDAAHFPAIAFSPLNPANPDMFPMTFHGMKMLHTLWTQSDCVVPPLDNDGRAGAVLLETMPGAVLWRLGFERRVYKRYKNSPQARDLRKEIVGALPTLARDSGVLLENFGTFTDLCVGVHDCLDSVIAAIAAAMWAQNSTQFRHPQPAELPDAQLEGWIYVPQPNP